jgi:hypothetical protein
MSPGFLVLFLMLVSASVAAGPDVDVTRDEAPGTIWYTTHRPPHTSTHEGLFSVRPRGPAGSLLELERTA